MFSIISLTSSESENQICVYLVSVWWKKKCSKNADSQLVSELFLLLLHSFRHNWRVVVTMSFFSLASSTPRLAARLLLLRKNCRRQLGGAASSYVATFLRAQGVKSSLGRIIGGREGDSKPYEEGGGGIIWKIWFNSWEHLNQFLLIHNILSTKYTIPSFTQMP